MKSIYLIFVGLFLLIAGIVMKYVTDLNVLPVILMAAGGLFKLAYILLKIVRREYKPGFEVLLLLSGLLLFFTGKNLQRDPDIAYAMFMMITGIGLKILFVLLFIRKRRHKKDLPGAQKQSC